MKKASKNSLILIIIGVILVAGLTILLLSRSSQPEQAQNLPTTSSTDDTQKSASTDEYGYQGKRFSSSQRAFSIVVPNGWKLTSNSQFDLMVGVTLQYDPTKLPVVEEISYGKDGPSTFTVGTSKQSDQYVTGFESVQAEEFITEAGQKGEKKFKTYTKDEPLGLGGAQGGEKEYQYTFKKDETIYTVAYFLGTDSTASDDNHAFIEKVVSSLQVK